jgi:hypothetical protein
MMIMNFFKIHTPTISAVSQPMVEISTEVRKNYFTLVIAEKKFMKAQNELYCARKIEKN